MALVQEYLELTKKYKKEYGEKTILLMEVGSFFEVYALINPDGTYTGSNIEEFAKINEMVIAKKNTCVGKLPVVMAGMGTSYAEKYIYKLQEHDYTIVIYRQESGNKTSRILSEIISPGTYFPSENDNDLERMSNNVMCIWLHKCKATKTMPCQVTIGLANIDIYTGKTALFQFTSNYSHSPATYDELERYISAYRPSECLFVANMSEKIINDIIGFVGLDQAKIHKIDTSDNYKRAETKTETDTNTNTSSSITTMETYVKNAEKQLYQVEILKKFFPHLSSFHEMFPTHSIAIQSFCFLLDFVYQHSPNLVQKLTEPVFENYTDRLILSNHTLNQLNIIDDNRHTGRLRSVSSLLNNCVTTMGKRQFMYNLHYPITHEATLQASYDITEHLLDQGEEYYLFIRNKLNTITDLEKFARRIITRKIMPKNLTALAEDLMNIESLFFKLKTDEKLKVHLQTGAISSTIPIDTACRTIINDLQRVFDLEICRNLSEMNEANYMINKGISPIIDKLLKDSMDGVDKLEAISNYLSLLVQQTEKKTAQYVKIHETSKSNAVLVCTSRRAELLKTAVGGIIKKEKSITATITYKSRYSNSDEMFELDLSSIEYNTSSSSKTDKIITNKQISMLSQENEINKIKLINEMCLVFQTYITDFVKFEKELTNIIKYTTEMDMLQCKAYTANKYNYCKPVIYMAESDENNKSFFEFTGIRHPLIEHLQTNELYVTNDMMLGANPETPDNVNGILLYGTNAVGKTSFIKSVGIAVIMAQAGLYVPCNSFLYKPYRNVFTRILGNDNIFKGLSTFAVEMTELRTILTMANAHSLVLGDELCSGTESDSALSIFMAGLEILHEKESTFLFATHFHEINKYEEVNELTKMKMMHMAVHYNKETNTLIYDRKLREGPGESMYGLEVCKSLNLPDSFLQRAHDIRMKYHPEKKNVLSLSTTHFNSKKLVGNCEICKKHKASEVHHLQYQKNASPINEYIANKQNGQNFHKNHMANLLNICEPCHKKIHKSNEEYKVVKTSDGYILSKI
jgi:DNA mismatch repair protein MutS